MQDRIFKWQLNFDDWSQRTKWTWSNVLKIDGIFEWKKYLVLTLSADGMKSLKWFVDGSYATHADTKIHTGSVMKKWKGSAIPKSTKQKLITKSSTEAELVGANDIIKEILWTEYFLKAQSYESFKSIMSQENKSLIRCYCVPFYLGQFWPPDFCPTSVWSLLYKPVSLPFTPNYLLFIPKPLIFMPISFFSASTVPVTYVGMSL